MKTISLLVYNNCGDSAEVSKVIEICPKPEARWTYFLQGTTSAGMEVKFDAGSSMNAVKYIWDFGDGTIDSSGPNPTHIYTTPGLHYLVTLTVRNSCGESAVHKSTLDAMVGLEERLLGSELEAFPNPARDRLFIRWLNPNLDEAIIEIFNGDGKQIFNQKIIKVEDELIIDTSKWPVGNYLLMVRTSNKVHVLNIMKLGY